MYHFQIALIILDFNILVNDCHLLYCEKEIELVLLLFAYRFSKHPFPIIALILVVIGVVIALIPQMITIISGQDSFASGKIAIVWCLIFILGVAPGAVLNVFEERFLVNPFSFINFIREIEKGRWA
jgi:hypothetical protein